MVHFMVAGYHGRDGPVSVSDSFATPKATYVFLHAAEELGYKEKDLNGEDQLGKCLFILCLLLLFLRK